MVRALFRYIALVADEMQFESFRAKLVEFAPEVEPAAMTIAEELISRGKAEGHAEGRAEGARDALAGTLSRLLGQHFGPVPAAIQARIHAAETPELEGWISRMIGADSLAAVFGDA